MTRMAGVPLIGQSPPSCDLMLRGDLVARLEFVDIVCARHEDVSAAFAAA